MPQVTITIDPDLCISAANCVGIAPEFFQIGTEPYVEILDRSGESQGTKHTFEATQAEIEQFEEAAESCPTRAIAVKVP